MLTRVGLPTGKGSHTPKDLRDCFASHLLTAGVPLERIQKYLGHSSVKVTETHYAKWCSDDEEMEALRLEPGEVRPDFLARLHVPHRVPHRQNQVSPAARAIVSILNGKEVLELGGLGGSEGI